MAFGPGELSLTNECGGETTAFDPGYLPCPPPSIRAWDFYKLMTGDPWKPMIAPPQKLRELDPSFAHYRAFWLQGHDPPTALTPQAPLADATSVEPAVTTDQSTLSSKRSMFEPSLAKSGMSPFPISSSSSTAAYATANAEANSCCNHSKPKRCHQVTQMQIQLHLLKVSINLLPMNLIISLKVNRIPILKALRTPPKIIKAFKTLLKIIKTPHILPILQIRCLEVSKAPPKARR